MINIMQLPKAVLMTFNGDCLQELADDLRSCKETLEAMNKLGKIDTWRSMVKIVERLPQSLQGQWRKSVVKTLEATGRYFLIARLTHFVFEAAREATRPLFRVSESKSKDSSRRGLQSPGSIGSSFGVQGHENQQNLESQGNVNDTKSKNTKTTPRDCRLCKGHHVLSVCSRLSPGER